MRYAISLFLMFIALISSLTGCRTTYTLSQQREDIENVDIVYVANNSILTNGFYDSIKLVHTVEESQWNAFFDGFFSISCSQYLNDPAESVTGEVIRLSYKDGSFELIGCDCVFYCTKEGDWNFLPYYFDSDVFYRFIQAQKTQGTTEQPCR